MEFKHQYALIDDINIHYVAGGPSGNNNNKDSSPDSTFVFLHGFPEYWQTWQAQLTYFSENHHVIAPDLPGYNLSDKPSEVSFFEIPHLIAFIVKFIKAVSPTKKVYLVAHDWGGVIAWPLAAFFPQTVAKLIILNAAHPSTFTREMINNPLQRNKSAYIHELISQQAETILSKNNYQYLSEKMMVSSNPNTFNEKIKLKYQQVWKQPGVINGMLQYYRAMPQLATANKDDHQSRNLTSTGPVRNTTEMKIPNIRVNVPTLILWGEQDQAFVIENLNDIEQYVPDCTIKRFEDASHWLMHEKSPDINHAIDRFIKT